MKRAITEAAKQLRYEEILDVAEALYEENAFEDIKITDIAKKAGLGKGTIFSYFTTKEGLFIGLMIRCYNRFFLDLRDSFEGEEEITKEAFTELFLEFILDSIESHKMLFRLVMIQHQLETNIDLKMAKKLKDFLYNSIFTSAQLLSVSCDGLSVEKGAKLLLNLQAIVMGYMVFSNPPEPIREALKNDELAYFRLDMEHDMIGALTVYMKGLLGL